MATNYLVLGQVAPSASTNSTLYTVPASVQAVVSTVAVCNRGSASAALRVAVRPDGASISNQHYVIYDSAIEANQSGFFTIGITMGDTDVLTVYASTASVSFSAFGSEVS